MKNKYDKMFSDADLKFELLIKESIEKAKKRINDLKKEEKPVTSFKDLDIKSGFRLNEITRNAPEKLEQIEVKSFKNIDVEKKINTIKKEEKPLSKKERWFKDKYIPYLKSKEWKTKRLLVLKRDNYVCQSCLKSKATEVHHLTYKHVFNEPLFELVSICNPCHTLITKLDRE